MTNDRVWRSTGCLADGREIIYFDERPGTGRARAKDARPLAPFSASPELRFDPLLEEWVIMAAHRQDRTFLPPSDQCPLDPTREGRHTEIPASDYDVAVFENRFPALAGPHDAAGPSRDEGSRASDPALRRKPGLGRCEVVCFTADHSASFAALPRQRVRTLVEVWADRTAALEAMPDIANVYPFENRGEEIGVTLHHPHGQIYGYPFVPPRIARIRDAARGHRDRTGGNLFDDVATAERKAGTRIVIDTDHWVAFAPAASRWPYEVQLFPQRRVPHIPALDSDQRADLAAVYQDLIGAFSTLFDAPAPYIAAWNQAPVDREGATEPDFGLHLQLFTLRRAQHRLKYLAGAESGMGTWVNDVAPEDAARHFRAALDTYREGRATAQGSER